MLKGFCFVTGALKSPLFYFKKNSMFYLCLLWWRFKFSWKSWQSHKKSSLPFPTQSNKSCLWLSKYNKGKQFVALRRVHSAAAERALSPDDQVRSQQTSGRSHINPTRPQEWPKTSVIMSRTCKNDNHHTNSFFLVCQEELKSCGFSWKTTAF
jgi:hypothetical protein